MEEFNQGLNWAYALAADAFGQLTKITGNGFLSQHMLTGYRITSVGDESIAAYAHNNNKDDKKNEDDY